VVALAALAIGGLAVGDVLTGTDASFTLLYLAPIAFATWFVGFGPGVGLSILASVASTAADALARVGAPLHPVVLAWNLIIQLGVYLAMAVLLAGFRSRLEGEQLLARTDALTQVANRRAFIEAAELELERARRTGRPLTLAFVDCDDFKSVNDELGHAEGDALLVVAAQTLRGSTRAVDAVARLGGDEFGLLLPETDGATAQALLGRVRATLLAAMQRHRWRVGFSIGAATFLTPAESVDQMLARADELMYQAKRTAKGTARFDVVGGAPPAPVMTPGPGPYGGA
jgi:diguanylate cyclase (GGDEF)-like protein